MTSDPAPLDRRAVAGGILRIIGDDAVLHVALEHLLASGTLDAPLTRTLARHRDRIAVGLDALKRLLTSVGALDSPDLRGAERIASISWPGVRDREGGRPHTFLIKCYDQIVADCETVLALARSVGDDACAALLKKHRRMHAAHAASLRRMKEAGFFRTFQVLPKT